MKINEIFYSMQGEIDVGRLALFIRLKSCNLQCTFCDTNYAKEEGIEMSIDDIFNKAKTFNRIVITGGEPMLQWVDIKTLVHKLIDVNPNIVVEIETNGTISPIGLFNKENFLFNVSLKLKNSENDYRLRINPYSINSFKGLNNVRYKFVIDTEDDVDEVIMLCDKYGLPRNKTYLMPLGDTKDKQLASMERVVNYCKKYGFNFSPRLHLLIWDRKRGV